MPVGETEALDVRAGEREQAAGSWFAFGARSLRAELLGQLVRLEQSSDPALALCGQLMRFAVASVMVHRMLPDGRPVRYRLLDGDEIPSQPLETVSLRPTLKESLDESQVPYTPAALRFFLPQWVVFDEKDGLLTSSLVEAESNIRSMQAYLSVLHHAVAIAPSLVADETYQRKRTGMLGQLVNQGRALARYEMGEIIGRILRRAAEGSLNRGLSLSLSYFDDQALTMKLYELQVTPVGRVPFLPAFVVLAVRNAYARIAQDTRLNSSTRKHLFSLLAMLEKAFLRNKE
jgi:hypothetical protein